jgi:hypothetical protein
MREQIVELERQRTALLRKCNAAQEFWAHVGSTLRAHRVNAVRDLPKDAQQLLVEGLTQLPHEGQMQLELARLERKKAELTTLLAQCSRDRNVLCDTSA